MNSKWVANRMLRAALLAPAIIMLVVVSISLNINYVMSDRKSRQAQAKALHMIRTTNKAIKATWKLATQ